MFNSSSDISSLQPSNLDEYKDKSDRSKLNDLIRTYQTTTKEKGDDTRKIGSPFPDSNEEDCDGITKSPKDLITTKFAGYVLQYPCTVNQRGSYSVEFAKDDSIIKQNYSLFLSAVLDDQSKNIWPDGKLSSADSKESFFMKLHSDGDFVNFDQIKNRIKKSENKIEINGLDVYIEKNFIIVFKKGINPDIGQFPHMICDKYGDFEATHLFQSFNDIGNKSQCGLHWRLTNDIKVSIIRMKSKYASRFLEIYQILNEGLQKAIIKAPS